MTRRRRAAVPAAVAVLVACWLAIIGAFALSQVDKAQRGTAVAIAVPAAVIFFAVLAWLGRQR